MSAIFISGVFLPPAPLPHPEFTDLTPPFQTQLSYIPCLCAWCAFAPLTAELFLHLCDPSVFSLFLMLPDTVNRAPKGFYVILMCLCSYIAVMFNCLFPVATDMSAGSDYVQATSTY